MSNNNFRFVGIRGNQNSRHKEGPVDFEIEIAGIKKDDFILEENSQTKVYKHSNILKIKRKNLKDLQIKNNLGRGGFQLFNCFNINYVNQYGMCNLMNLDYILNRTGIQSGGKYYEKSFNRPIGKIKNLDNKTGKRKYLGKKIRLNKDDTDKMLNKGYLYCGIINYSVHRDINNFHVFLEINAKGKNASEYEIGKLKLVEDGDFKELFNQLIFKKSQNIYNLEDSDINNYVKVLTKYTIILYISNKLPVNETNNDQVDKYDSIKKIIENQKEITEEYYMNLVKEYQNHETYKEMHNIATELIYFSTKTKNLQLNPENIDTMVDIVYEMIPKNSNINPVEYFENMVPILKDVIQNKNNWTSVSDIMHQYRAAKISMNSQRKTGRHYNSPNDNVYRASSRSRMISTKTNNK